MKKTNFTNLRELLKKYTPETFGIATAGECDLIKDSLQLEDMEFIEL